MPKKNVEISLRASDTIRTGRRKPVHAGLDTTLIAPATDAHSVPLRTIEASESDRAAMAHGIVAILAPLADLTHPILPEPVITDAEREAMIAALTALRDPESDPVEVPLPASCPDLASVQALAAVLRVTANRMGLAVQFYPRAPRVGVSLALMARRSLP